MDLMDYRRKVIASSPHLSHAEGAVATFTDGTDLPLKSLVVNIEPSQSGTGDPSPTNIRPISGWDAVGVTRTGKNLFDKSTAFAGNITASGGVTQGSPINTVSALISVKPNTTYSINNGAPSTMARRGYWYDINGNPLSELVHTPHGEKSYAITSPSSAYYVRLAVLLSDLDAMQFEFGSNATEYSPYTGTSLSVRWSRKNLLNPALLKNQAGWNVIECNVEPSTAYTCSTNCTDAGLYFYFNNTGTAGGSSSTYVTPTNPVTVTSTSEGKVYISQRIASGTGSFADYHYQLEKGSVATPYSPYDGNYLHINQWDEEWEVGSIDPNTGGNYPLSDRIRSSGYIPVLPNTVYSHNISMYVYQYDADKNFLAPRSDCYTGTFTTSPETRYIRFISYSTYGTVYKHDISINYPSTDTAYHPYNEFIVYGGTLNVLTGELVVDRYVVDPSQWTQYKANNGYKAYQIQNIPNGRYRIDAMNKPISNMIAKFGGFSSSAMSENIIQPPRENSNVAYLALKDGIDPTTVELSYLMLTPITYHLDPQTVRSLVGHNNIFADTGNVALDYWAHP